MPKILALDLSLRNTGIALYDGTAQTPTRKMLDKFQIHAVTFETLSPDKQMNGMKRLHWIRNKIGGKCNGVDLAIIEDLAFAAHDINHERAGLAYLIRHKLYLLKVPYVLVAPTTLKKFVTGSGKGQKSIILKAVYKNWNIDAKNDNEADAVGLLYLGLVLAGIRSTETNAQLAAVKTVRARMTPQLLKQLEGK